MTNSKILLNQDDVPFLTDENKTVPAVCPYCGAKVGLPEPAPKITIALRLCIVAFIPLLRLIYLTGDILLITAPQEWVDDWNRKIDKGR